MIFNIIELINNMNRFIDDNFENDIRQNVINKTYPNLVEIQKNMLLKYLIGLIQIIAICYDFDRNKQNFINKLKQNSYKDLRWLLTYLLPFLNEPSTELRDLNDLYTLKNDDNKKIDEYSPKYVFSNLQYGRCIRSNNTKEILFDESHIRDNYYLLLETIRVSKNKLHINWIDILPYQLESYQSTPLYAYTQNNFKNRRFTSFDSIVDFPIEKIKDIQTITTVFNKLKGISIEDIYNTISLNLYDSIISYKWTIFDIHVNHNGVNIYLPLISILGTIISFNDILTNTDWFIVSDNSKTQFIEEWSNLLSIYENNNEIVNDSIIINNLSIETIVKSIIVFFDRKYIKLNAMKKTENDYISLDQDNNHNILFDNVDDYDEHIKDINKNMILRTAKSIKPKYIYDYIRECIEGFKHTYYGGKLMTVDKSSVIFELFDEPDDGIYVTYKNLYNFCKSAVHISKNNIDNGRIGDDIIFSQEYERLPKTWAELSEKERNIFLDRVNQNQQWQRWFNINRNLYHLLKMGKIEGTRTSLYSDIRTMTENIYDSIIGKFVDTIFESMIYKGVLTYIVPENDLTDTQTYDFSDPNKKKLFVTEIAKKRFYQNNPFTYGSFYYLTGQSFGTIESNKLKLQGDKIQKYDYFDICSNVSTAWYVSTTYHWVAQIGFCHRFINNRVNYITGGTGAGKSTQVPKLYIYFLKAIDNINDSTVVVTVPRTNVAIGVSDFISKEMAVPIKIYDDKNIEQRHDSNYYVQFKHMNDEHADDGYYPKIRFVTDGSVLQDVKDPLLKTKRFIDEQTVYLQNNKYDVIIVDEAHEHNTNMDMILSLAKNATFYNNKIRLVIMSATMSADEPVYRRFYRDINDNRKYPLNNWIRTHNIDRVNTERRFHISSPDETTRFKITEYYRPNQNSDNIVIEIVNSSTIGDILLFKSGTREISESVEFLNGTGVLPNDVIALPYHAQLPDFCKNFIDKIHETLSTLRIDKTMDITKVQPQNIDGLKKGNNLYTRCILVATNIAEASISIPTLKFVVETGQEKTMNFNFEKRTNVLLTNYITDASRLQRKGRVGRVSTGTVYYTYQEGQLKDNKKQFNISVQDINQSVMLELLRDPNDKPICIDIINDIVSGKKLFNLSKKDMIKMIINEYKSIYGGKNDLFIMSLVKMITSQYLTGDKYYDYVGNRQYYDYDNAILPKYVYISGFDIEQLTDKFGEFYIVHPDELQITRNISGEIVNSNIHDVKLVKYDNKKNMMISNKIIVFWETLLNSCFVGIKYDGLNKLFYRTKLGELLRYCASGLSMFKDNTFIKMLVFGYGLSKNDDEFDKIINVVSLLSLLSVGNFTKTLIDSERIEEVVTKYISTHKTEKNINVIKANIEKHEKTKIYDNFKNNGFIKSDIQMLVSICDFIDNILNNKNFVYDITKASKNKELGNFYLDYKKGDLKSFDKDVSINDKRTKMARKKIFNQFMNEHNDKIDEFNNNSDVRKVLFEHGLNHKLITNYLKLREKVRTAWWDLKLDITNTGETKKIDIDELKILLTYHRQYIDNQKIDLIKAVLMLSKPYDIKKKVNNNTYVSAYNPNYDTLTTLSENQTFVDPAFIQDYIINMTENYEYETIQIVSNITINDLMIIANIYNPLIINRHNDEHNREYIDKYMEKQYPKNIPLIDKQPQFYDNGKQKQDFRNYNIPEHINAVMKLSTIVKQINNDIRQLSKESKIFGLLEKIDNSYHDYKKILLS